jgi:hypothetical protein
LVFDNVTYLPVMTPPAAPDANVRRDLIQRIDRFLAGLERMKRQPNRREGYHVRDALEHLRSRRYREAEDALIKAEHVAPLPAHTASMLATNQPVTVLQLRSQLEQIVKNGDA